MAFPEVELLGEEPFQHGRSNRLEKMRVEPGLEGKLPIGGLSVAGHGNQGISPFGMLALIARATS